MKARFLGLHTYNLGMKTREAANPFTGEQIAWHIDDGMTPRQHQASSAFLLAAGASEPDPDGFRKVAFSGDAYAHIRIGAVGAEIQIDGGEAPEIAEFVFRLAMASGMVVTSTVDPNVVAVLPGQHHPGIDSRWPNAVRVSSTSALEAWIDKECANGRMA